MEDRRRKSQLKFYYNRCIQISNLTIIASQIVADFQYVVYKYFTQIINVTDILLQFFWGRILYSLDNHTAESTGASMERTKMPNLRNGSKVGFEPGLT